MHVRFWRRTYFMEFSPGYIIGFIFGVYFVVIPFENSILTRPSLRHFGFTKFLSWTKFNELWGNYFFFCCSELNYLSTLYPFYLFLRISRISSLVFHVLSNFENIRQFTNTIQLISSNFRVAMVFYIIGTKFFILEMHKKIEITIKILVQALFGLLWCFSILREI